MVVDAFLLVCLLDFVISARKVLYFTNKLLSHNQGPKGGLWGPVFVAKPGAQWISLLRVRTEMLILVKHNPEVERWSSRAPNFSSWGPGAQYPFMLSHNLLVATAITR